VALPVYESAPGRFTLLDGHHRLKALKLIGLKHLEVSIWR